MGHTIPAPTFTLLIADDHPLTLAGIRRALEHDEEIEIIGEARSAPELLGLIERRRPSIVLTDLSMPGAGGTSVIREIRRDWPDIKIVVLSASDDPGTISAALEAGAGAYIVKNAELSDIGAVLRQTAARHIDHVSSHPSIERAPAPVEAEQPGLTSRERAILGAISDGLTTAAISRELWVSEHTVKFHLTNIYRKLGVPNRAAAVRYAVERGLAPTGR